ncbi:MAG: Type IV conjugative transfer system lipoprotein (TraV) [Rhodobacteraceae bacterium HLUCCA12]|nr:MAG: Type IV conjugative transfer system lipoprotein (TraV) [Rhodobacteraceae bacterium HLUCCA12]
MPFPKYPLFAFSLAAMLPITAAADSHGMDETLDGVTGAQILACEEDSSGEGCATILSRLFVCNQAESMPGCADFMALRDEAEAAAEDEADAEPVEEPDGEDAEEIDVEVRAEGEMSDSEGEPVMSEGDEPDADDADLVDGSDAEAPADGECPVLDSSDWEAWVNAMPGSDASPRLIVTGMVSMPSPGYEVSLERGDSDGSDRPVQEVELMATAPDMDASQVVTDYELRFEMDSPAPIDGTEAPFSAVRVMCGEDELAMIEPVEVAQ